MCILTLFKTKVLANYRNIDFYISRYVSHHKIHQLNQIPNYDYLGHPVNAYHFIRHVSSGWASVIDNVMNNDTFSLIEDLGKIKL